MNFQALTKLFSAVAFRDLGAPDGPTKLRAAVDASDLPGLQRRMRVRTIYDRAYAHILDSYRCEYFYKNEITNKILLKKHTLNDGRRTARLLTEFWVSNSKADLAVINGTSSVYEIKTELDNVDRLPGQLTDYSRLFDRIYVVSSASAAAALRPRLPRHVGLIVITDRGALAELKPAVSNKHNVDVRTIFRSMRELEMLELCRKRFDVALNLPNGVRLQALWALFKQLSPGAAHDAMVEKLRERAIHPAQRELIDAAPPSLKHLCIAKTMGIGQYRLVRQNLDAVV